jgi:hypothetical protein
MLKLNTLSCTLFNGTVSSLAKRKKSKILESFKKDNKPETVLECYNTGNRTG